MNTDEECEIRFTENMLAEAPARLISVYEKKHLSGMSLTRVVADLKRASAASDKCKNFRWVVPVYVLSMAAFCAAAIAIALEVSSLATVCFFAIMFVAVYGYAITLELSYKKRLRESSIVREQNMMKLREFRKTMSALDPLRGGYASSRNLKPESIREQLIVFAWNILRHEREFEAMRLNVKNVSHGMLAMKSHSIEFCQEQFRSMWSAVQDLEVFDPPTPKKWFFEMASKRSEDGYRNLAGR